ncbi:SpaH/EbpB family LPXTG-anchored major pilin [Lacticaseibacillus thailandensis]|uniref:Pilus specific protein n=1 Tax=Lacticaseibacillus thailandensis DSM 22698 = JCM 13996 TaxID=1423810 RepID=A0A0R2C4E7_9LACO|nr:SpaH/EbpB family LPXTG-anchored major pilin [Lacticaseibacillus thailandensis]KRM86577.1 pilus specific protein [Lacticaseibacillus thailandensis DSM 22698 = JCM 13996]
MKRAKIGYWGSLLGTLILLIGVLASLATLRPVGAATATTDDVSITIHKSKLTENTTIENSGLEQTMPGEPLEGAGFTIYNISEQFYQEYDGKNGQTLAEKFTNNLAALGDYEDGAIGAEKFTDTEGGINWQHLPAKTQLTSGASMNSVFIIVETTVPGTVTSGSLPMVVALPVADPNNEGQSLRDIHLYPKNYGVDKVLLDDEGAPATETQRHEVGDRFDYQARFTIPSNITDMKMFNIWDAFQGTGAQYDAIKSITVNGTSDDYLAGFLAQGTFVFNDSRTKWQYDFNLTDADSKAFFASLAGKTVTITYSAFITDDATPDTKIGNKFYVTYQTANDQKHDLDDDSTEVATGGHKFVKVSTVGNDKTLKGAKFVVQRGSQYAVVGKDEINWTDDINAATTYTSGEDGLVVVRGLADGQYQLVETQAPDGYVIKDKSTRFTIKDGSFDDTAKIYVQNDPENFGFLPMTGGMGWLAFLLAGIGLMGAALLLMRRRHAQA